jgi:hypothetical protein
MAIVPSLAQAQQPMRLETPGTIPSIPVSYPKSYSKWIGNSEPPTIWQDADGPGAQPGGNGADATGGGGAGADGGGGVSAADAVNPAAPISSIQFQNTFIPESYNSTGYANQFIVQPVISFALKPDRYFDYHIIRPTFPILEPVPDPDGIVPDRGGTGDITYLDVYFRESKTKEGLVWGVGPIALFPSAGNPSLLTGNFQTGLGEWQLGPTAVVINSGKKWITGALALIPFSLESDAYSVNLQLVANRILKDGAYVGIGDLAWKLDDQKGNYNIPLNIRIGKVFTFGKQPLNIFLQPQYTPPGLTSQPTAKYGVKLNITFLLPGAEFGYSESRAKEKQCGRGCRGCRFCN